MHPSVDERIAAMKGAQRSYTTVVVEGRAIPGLSMNDRGDAIELIVDHRFSVDFPREIAPQAAWLIANAMAVASGYAFLGSPNKDQPFAPQVARIEL